MSITFSETSLQGLVIINPHQFNDGNFHLKKYFEEDVFIQQGLPAHFSEFNEIKYQKGVLRGLHYQRSPSQGKLLYIISGSVFIAAIDLRDDSVTFGKTECFLFSDNQQRAIYIPEYFANGVLAMENNTIISYGCVGKFIPENCGGIIWNDVDLDISWPIDILNAPLKISGKDNNLQTLKQYVESYR
ncbi:dTDP-4-dehydrorhamnose 3,5-epimerase [Spirochaetia bacterium]|nr:dTDP-4-dehydrorhamnose 3,5-epimerase [Spirochaetia bacterium]